MIIKTVLILCGGKGTRLGAIGKRLPKTLIKVQGKPIIWYIIKILIKNGFNHFILPIGYKGVQIKKYFRNNKLFDNSKIELIDTGNNTTIAKKNIQGKKNIISNNFVLLNGDAIFDFNIKKHLIIIQNKNIDATFIGCTTKLPFGIIAKRKIKSLILLETCNLIQFKKKFDKSFKGHVYSGISIM